VGDPAPILLLRRAPRRRRDGRHAEAHRGRLRGEGGGPRSCSKYPPAFGIDLLIDDLEGVRCEGDRFGFRVLCVAPDDELWAEKVLAAIR
jgi:hypothetical protein